MRSFTGLSHQDIYFVHRGSYWKVTATTQICCVRAGRYVVCGALTISPSACACCLSSGFGCRISFLRISIVSQSLFVRFFKIALLWNVSISPISFTVLHVSIRLLRPSGLISFCFSGVGHFPVQLLFEISNYIMSDNYFVYCCACCAVWLFSRRISHTERAQAQQRTTIYCDDFSRLSPANSARSDLYPKPVIVTTVSQLCCAHVATSW